MAHRFFFLSVCLSLLLSSFISGLRLLCCQNLANALGWRARKILAARAKLPVFFFFFPRLGEVWGALFFWLMDDDEALEGLSSPAFFLSITDYTRSYTTHILIANDYCYYNSLDGVPVVSSVLKE
jgi:hypothetical protein